mmetsp:Transcript_14483/g.46247  ORF Transcript_14483/g.46247 Transcript_14483/m.46247 type:complete len:210 (-) Transcript_14483:132-761(-)
MGRLWRRDGHGAGVGGEPPRQAAQAGDAAVRGRGAGPGLGPRGPPHRGRGQGPQRDDEGLHLGHWQLAGRHGGTLQARQLRRLQAHAPLPRGNGRGGLQGRLLRRPALQVQPLTHGSHQLRERRGLRPRRLLLRHRIRGQAGHTVRRGDRRRAWSTGGRGSSQDGDLRTRLLSRRLHARHLLRRPQRARVGGRLPLAQGHAGCLRQAWG